MRAIPEITGSIPNFGCLIHMQSCRKATENFDYQTFSTIYVLFLASAQKATASRQKSPYLGSSGGSQSRPDGCWG